MNYAKNSKLEDLGSFFQPFGLWPFVQEAKNGEPYLTSGVATTLDHFFNWRIVRHILPLHQESWLLRNGKSPSKSDLCEGSLSFSQVLKKFSLGYALIIRKAEKSHPHAESLAKQFEEVLLTPVELQLRATPPHYLAEDWVCAPHDTFVLQSSGSEEFYLYKNNASETRRVLKAGDGLFIPLGYWYKARAENISFQLRIEVPRQSFN